MAIRKFEKDDGSAARFLVENAGVVVKIIDETVTSVKTWDGIDDAGVVSHWSMTEVPGYTPSEDELNLVRRAIQDAQIILSQAEVE